MVKVLFLNMNLRGEDITSDLDISIKTTEDVITLHDYHVIIIDTKDFCRIGWTDNKKEMRGVYYEIKSKWKEQIVSKIKQQLNSGGIVFVFCGTNEAFCYSCTPFYPINVGSYIWLPLDLGIVSEHGDT